MKDEKELKKENENIEEVKEVVKTNDKMKGVLLALVGILFIGLCIGFGYVLGDSNSNTKDDNNESKEEDKKEEKDDNEENESDNDDEKDDEKDDENDYIEDDVEEESKENDDEKDDEKDDENDYIEDDVEEESKENDDDGFANLDLSKVDVDVNVIRKLFNAFREDYESVLLGIYSVDDLNMVDSRRRFAYFQVSNDAFVEKSCSILTEPYIVDDGVLLYCGELGNGYEFFGNKDWKNLKKELSKGKTMIVSAAKVKEKYEELFGKNAEYVDGNFFVVGGAVYYDPVNKIYADLNCECGSGEMGYAPVQKIIEVKQDGKKLHLVTILGDEDFENRITYSFELEEETGNYIFVSRKLEEIK